MFPRKNVCFERQPIGDRQVCSKELAVRSVASGGQRTDSVHLHAHEECLDVVRLRLDAPRRAERLSDNIVGSFYILARSFELDHQASRLIDRG